METKVCYYCNEELPLSKFYRKRFTQGGYKYDGYDHRCKPCKDKQTKVQAWLNSGFKSLRVGYCECCGISEDETQIMLDHDHKTYHFRGFVCKSCNRRLGLLGDSFESVIGSDCDKMYKDYMKMARLRSGKGPRA